MNITAVKLGKILVPTNNNFKRELRGIIDRYNYYVKQREAYTISLARADTPELPKRQYYDQYYKAPTVHEYLEDRLGYDRGFEDGLVLFKNVCEHEDGWSDIRYLGKNRSPGFLHIVLNGSFTLVSGRIKIDLEVGDVFLLNPNKTHSVINSKVNKTRKKYYTNITMCRTVPLMCYNKSIAEILNLLED